MKKSEVAHLIDHTILKPEATHADVARIVEEGARFGTYSVCVSPSMLPLEVPEGLKVACVVGFPSGAVKPNVKAYEAKQAIADGADEIDMVINLEQWKDGAMYDRLGLENLYTTILDVQVPSLTVPVRPGRNLAVIIEVAAMNNRHKKMGYNAAVEFTKQINQHFDQAMSAQLNDN